VNDWGNRERVASVKVPLGVCCPEVRSERRAKGMCAGAGAACKENTSNFLPLVPLTTSAQQLDEFFFAHGIPPATQPFLIVKVENCNEPLFSHSLPMFLALCRLGHHTVDLEKKYHSSAGKHQVDWNRPNALRVRLRVQSRVPSRDPRTRLSSWHTDATLDIR